MRRSFVWLFVCAIMVAVARGQGHEIPELRAPHGELAPTFWEQHGWQVLIGGAVFVILVVVGILLLRRPKRFVPEPPGMVARRALESWRGRVEDGALVADVSRVLRHYVKAAFSFPAGELTTTEFRTALQSHPQISPNLAAATADFLRRCDQWKFAPTPPTPRLGAVTAALELVGKMESSRTPMVEKTS